MKSKLGLGNSPPTTKRPNAKAPRARKVGLQGINGSAASMPGTAPTLKLTMGKPGPQKSRGWTVDKEIERDTRNWKWDDRREKAALMLAEDIESDAVIAYQCGVTVQTIARWKRVNVFNDRVNTYRQRVNEQLEQYRSSLLRKSIADRYKRIDSMVDDFARTSLLIEERAEAYAEAPGGKSGLLARDAKIYFDKDGNVKEIPVYKFDGAVINAREQLRKGVAEELGERQTNTNILALTVVKRVMGVAEDEI
jgi:hypothetical protein